MEEIKHKVVVDIDGLVVTGMWTQKHLAKILMQDNVQLISVNDEGKQYRYRRKRKK